MASPESKLDLNITPKWSFGQVSKIRWCISVLVHHVPGKGANGSERIFDKYPGRFFLNDNPDLLDVLSISLRDSKI
jgi:hypothetical protein